MGLCRSNVSGRSVARSHDMPRPSKRAILSRSRFSPDGPSKWRKSTHDRQPPSEPEAEVVSDPVLVSSCARFRQERFSLRAARTGRIDSREACFLYRGTRHRPVRAEHAAMTWLWLENDPTALAVVKEPARIGWHRFSFLMPALGTSEQGS